MSEKTPPAQPDKDMKNRPSRARYDKVHAVNARGPFRLATRFGARMATGDGGSIINDGGGDITGFLFPEPVRVPRSGSQKNSRDAPCR